ncbi:MAG: DHH family phosphoesterase [Paludibacteraceae bacterium]|nr:DHH family phosphoesterase [Paludibacteraceae bacterium]
MITNWIDENTLAEARQMIAGAHRVVILTHMAPDGDAMGSSLGLKAWLEEQGKEVAVAVPSAYPDFLGWMPGANEIMVFDVNCKDAVVTRIREAIAAAELVICSDFNDPKRIGAVGEMLMEERAARADKGDKLPILLIDHHLNPSDVADVLLSFPQSPSASEIVYRLIRQLGGTLSLQAGTCLYTGMMTDTGNFAFNSNHPEMYEIVGDLVRIGVDKDKVYDRVFNAYSAHRMRLMGYCLYHKMEIYPEHHVAFIYLTRRELARFQFQSGDAEGLVNLPMQIKDVYYSCFMREDKVYPSEQSRANGSKVKVKISMRSKGDRPVNQFCHEVFNGGGHKNASGGEYYGSLAEAVQLFKANYAKYCNK